MSKRCLTLWRVNFTFLPSEGALNERAGVLATTGEESKHLYSILVSSLSLSLYSLAFYLLLRLSRVLLAINLAGIFFDSIKRKGGGRKTFTNSPIERGAPYLGNALSESQLKSRRATLSPLGKIRSLSSASLFPPLSALKAHPSHTVVRYS